MENGQTGNNDAAESGAQQNSPQPGGGASSTGGGGVTADLQAEAKALRDNPKSAYWNEGRTPEERAAHDRAVATVYAAVRQQTGEAEDANISNTRLMHEMSVQLPLPSSGAFPNPASVDADEDLGQFLRFSRNEGIPARVVNSILNEFANALALGGGRFTPEGLVYLEQRFTGVLHPETFRRLHEWAKSKLGG